MPSLPGKYLFEDSLLTFVAYWNGLVIDLVSEPLVLYRSHASSLSNSFHHRDGIRSMRMAELKASEYSFNKYELFHDLSLALGIFSWNNSRVIDVLSFMRFLYDLRMRGSWYKGGLFSRVGLLLGCAGGECPVGWVIPRFFGVRVFSFFRFICYFLKGSLK